MAALRPPSGYALDRAVGTTFSLDLLALLTAPLAFTVFDWEEEDGRPGADPLTLLETMRRYAEHIDVFCQAGQIAVPRGRQLLYSYLENSVHEVAAPHHKGTFHPKVWALRFIAPDEPVLYRLLCLSRNLTFDRSWDTMLALDGVLTERKNAFASNHPLGDFFEALRDLAVNPLPQHTKESVDIIQRELRRVRFEVPEGFSSLAFRPLGIRGASRWPFRGRIDRLLVVSPFVSDGMVERLAKPGWKNVLISRLESLEALDPSHLEGFERVLVLDPATDPEESGDEEPTENGEAPLRGLHAKLYVADAGWEARVWTGSANATNAAFGRNVEFLMELTGKKSRCGVDKMLDQSGEELAFADLLRKYAARTDGPPPNGERKRLEQLLEEARRALATVGLRSEAITHPVEENSFEIRLGWADEGLALPAEISARCWPITLPVSAPSLPSRPSGPAVFGPLSLEALTSFYAVELTVDSGKERFSRRFVMNVPLEGIPSDRGERVMRSLLDNREKVLRMILLLLAEGGGQDGYEAILEAYRKQGSRRNGGRSDAGFPLFEGLVRALERDPAKLDRIARLLDDLRKTPEGEKLIPEGLETIWEPITSVRERLRA